MPALPVDANRSPTYRFPQLPFGLWAVSATPETRFPLLWGEDTVPLGLGWRQPDFLGPGGVRVPTAPPKEPRWGQMGGGAPGSEFQVSIS